MNPQDLRLVKFTFEAVEFDPERRNFSHDGAGPPTVERITRSTVVEVIHANLKSTVTFKIGEVRYQATYRDFLAATSDLESEFEEILGLDPN
jgi:hypothetical protein